MSNNHAASAHISQDPGYSRLKDYLIAFTGLAYYHDHDEYLAELIANRLSKLGLNDCASYSQRLADGKQGSDELDILVADLTIGETYFFRDREQFDAIRDIVIPNILERNQATRRLRIWSAGCANGAEPYSLAILLKRELGGRLRGWDIVICATDINRQSLADAQAGRFNERALRSIPDAVKRECFSNEGRVWTIHPEFKQWITFTQTNLAESELPSPLNHRAYFDLILCRNVMIYFAADTVRRLILQFHESLTEGGWFVAGAAEHSADSFNCFDTIPAPGATVYQKSATSKISAMLNVGQSIDALPQSPALPAHPEHRPVAPEPASIDELRRRANQGDWEGAFRQCETLLAQDALNPSVHFYHALLLKQMGHDTDAERALRRTLYLDRRFLLAHYHLGLALAKCNQPGPAAHCFENLIRLLSESADQQAVDNGDGLTTAALKQMARTQLRNLGSL